VTEGAPLAGRNALVLGVEHPAGRIAAVALAEAGANVAVVTISEDTKAEFAANSTANEFWALGRKGIALTSDGGATTVAKAIADAPAELGAISILVWHAQTSLGSRSGVERPNETTVQAIRGSHAHRRT